MAKIHDKLSKKTQSMYFGSLPSKYPRNRKGDGFQEIDDIGLTSRPTVKMADGSTYEGQWNAQNKRDGYGIEFNINGNKY
jgi:hypothetical protein